MTIKICGYEYNLDIREMLDSGQNGWGYADHKNRIIEVKKELCGDTEKETIFHEVLHCCDFAAETNLSEHDISVLSRIMYATLKDNPKLLKMLFP